MKNFFAVVFNLLVVAAFSQTAVRAKKTPAPYSMHGITITDDYPWLENIKSPETLQWVEEENKITDLDLEKARRQYNFEKKIREYDMLKSNSLPQKKGNYFYSRIIMDKNKPAFLFYRKKMDDQPIELLNPSKIYPDKNVFFEAIYPSKSSGLLAFFISTDGSDKQEIRFLDINKKTVFDDVISDVKFSNA